MELKKNWVAVVGVVLILGGAYWWWSARGSLDHQSGDPSEMSSGGDGENPGQSPVDLAQDANSVPDVPNPSTASPDANGTFAGSDNRATVAAIPSAVVAEMRECLEIGSTGGGDAPVEVPLDALIESLGREWGSSKQGDMWTDWLIQMKDSSERKIHLENVEEADGRIRQTVAEYMIDPVGNPFPVPFDQRDKDRPAVELVTSILGQGEVKKKEHAAYVQFARGQRVESIDVGGHLAEIEVVKDETLFRCDRLAPKPSCQCIK